MSLFPNVPILHGGRSLLSTIPSGIFNAVGEASSHAFTTVSTHVVNASNAVVNFVTEHPRLTATAVAVLLLALFGPALAHAIVGMLGFGPAGVQAGSIAAQVQSSFYGGFVPAGSIFASLQSFGALLL